MPRFSEPSGQVTELEVQADRINEQVKENNMDNESRVLTKIHVPGEESLYFCTCVSPLRDVSIHVDVCAHSRTETATSILVSVSSQKTPS